MPDRDWQAEIALLQERERKARAILGVSETADRAEIRLAFRRASRLHHPDVNGGSEDSSREFHLVCCAYKFLAEGQACAALDQLDALPAALTDGKFRRREKYFGEPT